MTGHRALDDLLGNCRAMTSDQLLKYYSGDARLMRRALEAFRGSGLVQLTTELVRERRDADSPITVLQPGETHPMAGGLAYSVRGRWGDWQPKLIIRGTAKLALLYGGQVQPVASGHLSHEIGLVDILLHKRQSDPEFQWQLVAARPGLGVLPDAITAESMIELIGQYNTTTIRAKIGLAARYKLEIW